MLLQNILIIRLSSIGDIILTSYLIRILKNKFPDSNIDFMVDCSFKDILLFNPRINKIIVYDKKMSKNELLNFKTNTLNSFAEYDLIIDLQNNLRTRKLLTNIDLPIKSISKNRLAKLSLVFFKKNYFNNIPQIPINYSNAVSELDLIDDKLGLEFWTKKDADLKKYLPFEKKYTTSHNPKICIAPGAHFFTKRYPIEYQIELIKLLKTKQNADISLVGGNEDIELGKLIESKIDFKISNFIGQKNIIESAEIIDESDLVISNDSAIMHIAAARQIPLVGIFGSTTQDFGFSPFRVRNIVCETKLSCRPCSHIGKNQCPKSHFKCMMNQKAEDIFSAVLELTQNIFQY